MCAIAHTLRTRTIVSGTRKFETRRDDSEPPYERAGARKRSQEGEAHHGSGMDARAPDQYPGPFTWRRRENSLHFVSLMNEKRHASHAIHVRYRAHVANPDESLWHPKAATRRDDSEPPYEGQGCNCGDRMSQHRGEPGMEARIEPRAYPCPSHGDGGSRTRVLRCEACASTCVSSN